MRRPLAILLVIAAALAAVAPSAGAHPRRGVSFALEDAGFSVQGWSAPGSDRMRLRLYRRGEAGYYYVKARLGEGTVRARFGRLGSVDLRFTPGRGEGALGCGEGGWQRGGFVGRIVFRGEHDYAGIDARRAAGWFADGRRGGCGKGARADRGVAARASRLTPVAETGALLSGQTGRHAPFSWVYIGTRNGPKGLRVLYNGFRVESREGMRIERGGEIYTGAKSFTWDLGRKPPRPRRRHRSAAAPSTGPAPRAGRRPGRDRCGSRSSAGRRCGSPAPTSTPASARGRRPTERRSLP